MLDQDRFNQPSVVHGVAIQGRDSFEQWVTSYSVLYSTNCLDFVSCMSLITMTIML